MKSKDADVKSAGLEPRGSFRLEAGLCLNDIDEDTAPVEAMLVWTIRTKKKDN